MMLRKSVSKFAAVSALVVPFVTGAAIVDAQEVKPVPRAEVRPFSMFLGGESYLGVQTENVTKENSGKYNLREPRGVAVVKVSENSPASQAGLRDGDVIVRFEGEEVKSVSKLQRLIAEVAPDQKARVTVLRNGSEQELTVTMGKRLEPQFRNFGTFPEGVLTLPPGQSMPRIENMPRLEQLPRENFRFELPDSDNVFVFPGTSRRLGVTVSSLTRQLGDYFGVADGKGVLIENVAENSPAAKSGLKAGDVIVEIDGAAVSNQADLTRGLSMKAEGEISLTIVRNRQRQTVRVTPEANKALIDSSKTMRF
ncbi:MAG: PDZ domain-containing protein [Acidobacteriota bacterium]|nr:PDZ domain-containing protein [Acidobacteriota bacterium]